MHRVFVYGTLKKGYFNHNRIFAGCNIKITPAWTYGELYDLGRYPALTPGRKKVLGEIIEFDDPEILRKIDILEGYRGEESSFNFYHRKEIMAYSGKGKFTTWAYFLKKSKIIDLDGEQISFGKWIK